MIGDNLQAVISRIAAATAEAGRAPGSVRLLAASKTQPPARIAEAAAAGQRAFGENYVQEAIGKMDALAQMLGEARSRALEWHLIGPVQSNKTRVAAERFDWVQCVDREKIARRLSEQRPAALAPLNVLIEVNLSGEASKSGVAAEDALALARTVAGLPRLRLRGLMAIPAPSRDQAVQRERFRAVRRLFERLRAHNPALDTLSMGMSDDMEAAIAEGATMVRIGSAIFGARAKVKSAA
ncbi:MAG TPA: YggS family pyridoxal phosphate-dependent enzyme [Burkholderiales bacterium]|nr:YggS family pyridoxal phosphate-dependent enzyme [Burkholderiales bacterium]